MSDAWQLLQFLADSSVFGSLSISRVLTIHTSPDFFDFAGIL